MQNITGKIAFGGIAIGKIKEISKENNVVRRVKIEDAKAEIARFEAARDQAAEELKGLYDKAVKEVGEANAAIFEVHQMMLEDEDYLDSVRNIIEHSPSTQSSPWQRLAITLPECSQIWDAIYMKGNVQQM